MKIVIGNYQDPADNRNLILNDEVLLTSSGAPSSVLFAIVSKIEGIETPPFRNGTGDWSGADGGYISSQLFSARTITISGTYIDRMAGCDYSTSTTQQFDHLARLYMRSRLPIRTKQKIRLFMDSGMTFYTEGYCTDIQMEYTFIGHGDYQISIYCPDPALYRGERDGTLGSEWNSAILKKTNEVGFVSSGLDSLGDPYYATWEPGDDDAQGIVWGTGGRSTPIIYNGDFPYYPQFIVSPVAGKHVVNPKFTSVTENRFFGLGYPDTKIALFSVDTVDSAGGITSISIDEAGAYEADYSGTYGLMNYHGSNSGGGAVAKIIMAQGTDGLWSVSSITRIDSDLHWGTDYEVDDILSPSIPGASALVLSNGDTCIIDMAEHTALVNGSSVSYYITPGSEWFDLQALKTNNIAFSSALADDDDAATIRWRDGYQGI